MKRLDSLQLGRALAVLSVLFFHLLALSTEYANGYFSRPWIEALRAGVDVFFVISGVVMVVTTSHELGEAGTAKRFLIHRVSPIYPPYLFLTVLLKIYLMARPDAQVNSHSGGVDWLSSYTLWPSVKQLPIVQVGWTLSYQMMFYLVFFYVIVFASKERLLRALGLWLAAVSAGFTAITMDSSGNILRFFPRAAFVFSPYVFEFVAGCFIGLAYLKRRFAAGKTAVILALSIFALEGSIFQSINFDGHYRLVAYRVLLFGPPAALLVFGLLGWETRSTSLHAPRWAVRCGDISYSIYLVHLLALHFAYRYVWPLFKTTEFRSLFVVTRGGRPAL